MRPTKLTMRGVTCFKDVTVDLSELPIYGLVGIAGDIGVGKTSFLECLCPAPLWLEMPTRPGNLADNCTSRKSMIELWFDVRGDSYRSQVVVDIGKHDKSVPSTKAWLWCGDELKSDDRGKVGRYKEVIAELLPPRDLVLASAFAAQDGSGSFGKSDVHARRKLFRSMLGLDALQSLSDQAAEKRKPLDATLAEIDADAARLAVSAKRVGDIKVYAVGAEIRREGTQAAYEKANATHEAARTELTRLEMVLKSIVESRGGREDERKKLSFEFYDTRQILRVATGGIRDCRESAARWESLHVDNIRREEAVEIVTAARTMAHVATLKDTKATAAMDAAMYAAGIAREELGKVEAGNDDKLAQAQTMIAHAEEQAADIDRVPCKGNAELYFDPWDYADVADCSTCPMLERAVIGKKSLPQLRGHLADIERENGDKLREAKDAVDSCERHQADTERHHDVARRESVAAWAKSDALQRALDEMPDESEALAEALADKILLPEAKKRFDTLTERLQSLSDRLDALPELPSIDDQTNEVMAAAAVLDTATDQLAEANLEHTLAAGALERLRGELETIGDVAELTASNEATKTQIATRRAGLHLIERGFGPEGIQALEIDAAGPSVSRLTNELLEGIGASFSVEIVTLRLEGRGRKQKEIFDINVHDGRSGTSRELGRMSGGEQVLVEESLKLAIAVHVAQRTGKTMDTLFRDEMDGSLSEEMGLRYPDMLRHAMVLGGFGLCFFISHKSSILAQADAIIDVADGTVVVRC